MVPVVIPQATHVFTSSPDWDTGKDGICEDLHVIRDDANNVFTSFWKPNLEEIENLKNGAYVMLGVKASFHPAVSINVALPDYEIRTANAGPLAPKPSTEVKETELAKAS